jgi:hypothetical protein
MPPPCHCSSQKVRFSNGAGDVKCPAVAYSGVNKCHSQDREQAIIRRLAMDTVTPVERLGSLRKAKLCTELYREGSVAKLRGRRSGGSSCHHGMLGR